MINPKLVIFGTIAIGAAVAAAVSAAWAGYKTAEVVKEKDIKTKKEAFKATWKYWIPTGVSLAFSVVSDICLIHFGMITAAAVTGAISITAANRKKVMDKVKSMMDTKEFKEFKKDLTKEKMHQVDFAVQDTGYGKTICYLDCIDKYFLSDPMEVQKAIQSLKWEIKNHDKASFLKFVEDLHISLREFERMAYEDFGWFAEDIDNDKFDFIECEMTEGWIPGRPDECYIITCYCEPYFIEEPGSQFLKSREQMEIAI